jgi:predicted phage replisome organizer
MMSEVKWIKIVTDIFDDEKILLIESLPEADGIIVIWFKLLCLAGKQNNNGVFLINNTIPYTDKMLATIFRRKESTVQMALRTFEQFGMIEMIDGVITIPKWDKHQNVASLEKIREDTRIRVSKHREKQKMLAACNVTGNVTSNVTVTRCNAIEEEKKEDIEEDKEKKSHSRAKRATPRHKYGVYQNVLLSDEELETLKAEYPDWEKRVERLSEYIASRGDKYKSHLATIRSWARRDGSGGGGGSPAPRPSKVNPAQQYVQRKYDSDAIKARVAVDIKALLDDDDGGD